MNRAEERVLAWALADAAAPFLTAEVRVGVNAKIGAGELDGAIVDVLTLLGRAGATISRDLATQLSLWLAGYLGAPVEAQLRGLVERIPLQQNGTEALHTSLAPRRPVIARSAVS